MTAESPTLYPPIDLRRASVQLVGGGLLLALALCVVGWAFANMAGGLALVAWEGSVNGWFVDQRRRCWTRSPASGARWRTRSPQQRSSS